MKLDVQGQGDGTTLDVDGEAGVGGLKNGTIFMNVLCVSSLTVMSQIQYSHFMTSPDNFLLRFLTNTVILLVLIFRRVSR